MTANDDFDFSIKTAPADWNEAAPAQPDQRAVSRPKQTTTKKLPSGKQADLFSASFIGIAVCLTSGVGWYLLENRWNRSIWWAPAIIGLLIALAVRISAGAQAPGLRCGLALALYSVTILGAGVALARKHLIAQFAPVDFRSLESQFQFDLLSRGESVAGLIAGVVAIVVLSIGLSDQR